MEHIDFIANGRTEGQIANHFAQSGQLNVGNMRPFLAQDKDGSWKGCISTYKGGDVKDPANYIVTPIRDTDLRTNAVLRREEWMALDAAIMEPSRYRLGGVDDLISRGLVYNLGNGLGTTVLEWHDVSEAAEAELTMDALSRGKGDRVVYQHNYLPIPIIHVDYEINARVLAASRNLGNPLDTTMAERAARRVVEKLETMLFTDTTYAFGETDSRSRNKIYSYVNFPDRNQVNLSANWDASGVTGAAIIQDVLEMKQASINAYHYGPWQIYIPTAYETVLDADYDDTTPGTTIRERIMKISGISGIKVVDTLAANNVLMIQMTPDVVRLVRGMGLQNVQWSEEGNMVTKFKVMTIQVPQIRSDQNGKCGIVHLA